MRKWFVMSVIGGLALLPAAAFADVDLSVEITKSKDKRVSEELEITKDVDIEVEVELRTQRAAESETLVNQKNESNDEFNYSNSSVSTANVSGSGIVGVNQASGNMNNQANAVSVAVDPSGNNNDDPFDPDSSFAHSQAASDQKNEDNKAFNLKSGSGSSLSVNGSGIINANQASGSMNNQANAVSVAVGAGLLGVAISEADLGQVNSYNSALSIGGISIAQIPSVTGSGIIGINQSSGHMNNQSNVVSVAVVN